MSDKPKIPSNVTPDVFRTWRSPRRGTGNPQEMNNPFWEWLIKTRMSAYQANDLMDGPPSMEAGPCWCFDRFGQSQTDLPDGRVVLIGGEHEDYYDADFYIYNDVVIDPEVGVPEIYGYSSDAFPPTDFHTATLVGESIWVIGSLAYPDDRVAGHTQVLCLDLGSLAMSRVETSGTNPGWIHRHTATLADDDGGIIISGGKVDLCDNNAFVENIDEWRLDLDSLTWERLSNRAWPRFEVHRKDRKPNLLWHLRQLHWMQEVGWDDAEKFGAEVQKQLSEPPRLEQIETLYVPDLADEIIADDEYNVFRARVGDVVVRYVEDSYVVQVTVEGPLPAGTVEELKVDLLEKLDVLEQAPWTSRDIPNL